MGSLLLVVTVSEIFLFRAGTFNRTDRGIPYLARVAGYVAST